MGLLDQEILLRLIEERVGDENIVWLLQLIVKSFKKGIPLGNVTSQIFANIYLNELDQFIKRTLKINYYIRYCDDFVILSENKKDLENLIPVINSFLQINLRLMLHPSKISIRKYYQGIDFLGYVSFPHHRVLRVKTGKRMFKKIESKIAELESGNIEEKSFNQTLWSYYGMLKHCDSYKLGERLVDFMICSIKKSIG